MSALDPWMMTARHEAGHCLVSLAIANRAHELKIWRTARGFKGHFRERAPDESSLAQTVDEQTRESIDTSRRIGELLRDAGKNRPDTTSSEESIMIKLGGLIAELAAGEPLSRAMEHADTDLTRARALAAAITRDKQQRDYLLGILSVKVAQILDANTPAADTLTRALAERAFLNEPEIRMIVEDAGFPAVHPPRDRPALGALLRHFPDVGSLTSLRRRTDGIIFKAA